MKQTIVISEILKTSWKALKSQIWILVGLLIGYMIISITLSAFANPTSMGRTLIVNIIALGIGLIFNLGYIKNLFQTLDGIEPQFSAYGQQARKIGTYFAAYFIAMIAIIIGLALLVFPGIYLAIRLQYFVAFIVEEDAGIIDSLKRSWKITEGQVLPLFLLFLAMFGLILLGVILLGIGVLITSPLVYMMYCVSFRKLNSPLLVIEEA